MPMCLENTLDKVLDELENIIIISNDTVLIAVNVKFSYKFALLRN